MPSGVKYHLAVLASGGGSNADKICSHFYQHPEIRVGAIITNNRHAGVIGVAERHGINSYVLPKSSFHQPSPLQEILARHHITHIVLAGFLLLVPEWLIRKYHGHIINIHPALLPRFGGKGMYGHHVHSAVKEAGDLVSGITIHEVNERYDEGKILFQEEVVLNETDSPEEIAAKVLRVEHQYYPLVIEKWVLGHPVTKNLQ